MLQNHQHQGLIVEDQALGMMGFFSNPSSNNLTFLPHHDDHHQFTSSHGHQHQHQQSLKSFAAMLPSSIPSDDGDVDVDDDDDDTRDHDHHRASSNNSSDLCQALLMSSCANPKPRYHHHHQDQDQDPASLMGLPTHLLSLQRSNPSNLWEWRSSGSECMVSNERGVEDHDNLNSNDNMNKKNLLGVSALRMKKMKGRRKVREPRFCFKTLSDVDVLDDGYKWRKYGQKVVKNTQHPRSYYRCTQDNCRVKKRVERLAEDPRMVITTYEGRHVHSPSHDTLDDDSNRAQPLLNNFFW